VSARKPNYARLSVLLGLCLLLVFGSESAEADHGNYFLRLPWQDGATRTVTMGQAEGTHTGAESSAIDFDLLSTDEVRASHEGTVLRADPWPPCDPGIPPGQFPNQFFGNRVVLESTVSGEEGWWTSYAHLASFAVIANQGVFQGAALGSAGDTGHTEQLTEPPLACAVHLHFTTYDSYNCSIANCSGTPKNATVISNQTCFATDCSLLSDNARIGDQSIDPIAGFEIDAEYYEWGQWTNIGWVSNAGRGLPMHRYGSGWEQNFGSHDDLSGGTAHSGIYVPDRRVQDDAFWVQPEFWPAYEGLGGATGFLQYPVGEQVIPCPSGGPDPCDTYQDFECGYIWRNGTSILTTHTCAGLYSIAASGGEYRRLAPETAGWGLEDEDDAPSASQNLKSYGELMVHKQGISSGQGFFVSQDGGETWSATAKPLDDLTFRPVDADFCAGSPPRLWMAWQDWGDSSTHNRLRIYYSDDFGATITLSSNASIGGFGAAPAHPNGSVTCHPTDPNRVAVVVQQGSNARVRVTTNGGGVWSSTGTGSLANAYRMVWSGNRLVLVYDGGSSFYIRKSDDNGSTWPTAQTFSNDSGRTAVVDVINTSVSGLVFAFFDPTSPDHIVRSTDNGDTWEQVGALPSGLVSSAGIRGMAYDAQNDYLYAVWNTDKVVVLRNASVIDWDGVAASDWITLPSLGGIHVRSLALDGSGSLGLLAR
jgi:murein DD-endopeptidase MepM/ murein hydrolase activator NlpD